MGKHYVPQQYLHQFATLSDEDEIWMFDKQSKEFKLLPIKSVAQAPDFYSADDEEMLAKVVERPAQKPLKELQTGQGLEEEDRRRVAVYLESMIKRVPRTRKMARNHLKRTPEFESLSPSEQKDIIRRQWSSEELINCLMSMTWRVIKTDSPSLFITGDNPVSNPVGLKPLTGEFSFALSPHFALHGSQQGPQRGLLWINAIPSIVKEINRRVVAGSDRFVFCHQKATWVKKISRNPRPTLNQIQW